MSSEILNAQDGTFSDSLRLIAEALIKEWKQICWLKICVEMRSHALAAAECAILVCRASPGIFILAIRGRLVILFKAAATAEGRLLLLKLIRSPVENVQRNQSGFSHVDIGFSGVCEKECLYDEVYVGVFNI